MNERLSVDVAGPVARGAVRAGTGIPWDRRAFYVRAAWLAAAVALLLADARTWLVATSSGFVVPPLGTDFELYRDAAARPGFYSPYQLAGPYDVWGIGTQNILYPPTTIPLFAAFNVLPAFLWWVVPLGIIGAVVAWHRPRPLALLVIAGLVLWPTTLVNVVWTGNPSMWCAAALALATTGRSWAAAMVLLKPTLAPFALWGAVHGHNHVQNADPHESGRRVHGVRAVPEGGALDQPRATPAVLPTSRRRSGLVTLPSVTRHRGAGSRRNRYGLSLSWLAGMAMFAAVSVAFLPMWFDYATVIGNARNAGWSYQLWHVPIMLVPVLAWIGRRLSPR